MEDLNYTHDAIALIGNLCSQSTIMIIGKHFNKTQPIPIQRGTVQGDTLSSYLFVIFLNPHLKWSQKVNNIYRFQTSYTKLSFVAYANDLATVVNKWTSLQTQLNKLNSIVNGWEWTLANPNVLSQDAPTNLS